MIGDQNQYPADEERLRAAASRVGLDFGCDSAEHMADEILLLRERLDRLRIVANDWVATGETEEDQYGYRPHCGTQVLRWLEASPAELAERREIEAYLKGKL